MLFFRNFIKKYLLIKDSVFLLEISVQIFLRKANNNINMLSMYIFTYEIHLWLKSKYFPTLSLLFFSQDLERKILDNFFSKTKEFVKISLGQCYWRLFHLKYIYPILDLGGRNQIRIVRKCMLLLYKHHMDFEAGYNVCRGVYSACIIKTC